MSEKATKVLVVDDSQVINKILTENITSQLHLDVVSAYTMNEAIEAIGRYPNQFFVAVLDLNLPDAPHGEVVQALVTLGIRPIILTASMSDDLHDEMMSRPIIDYVVKRNLSEMQYVIDQIKRLYDNFERRVLIVDDSRLSRQLLRSLLERHNYSVDEAKGPDEGYEMLTSDASYSLLITDYNMGDTSGAEFIVKVRAEFTRHELSIIGVSGIGSGRVSVQMLKAGANDFITRPFMHEEFYCRVNQNIDAVASYQELKNQAFKDHLTGLYNRRYLFETSVSLYENAKRQNLSVAVAMMDVDSLKRINEEYGHKVGDMALQHLAKLFRRHFRDGDIIARMGGEEFGILCVNLDPDAAHNVFERFRLRVEATPLLYNNESVPFTISIGYTLDLNNSFEAMVAEADKQRYKAKTMGRNRVATA